MKFSRPDRPQPHSRRKAGRLSPFLQVPPLTGHAQAPARESPRRRKHAATERSPLSPKIVVF